MTRAAALALFCLASTALAVPPPGAPGPLQPSWPVGAIGPDPRPVDCDVELLIASLPQPDGTYTLLARARSWVAHDLQLTVPNTCPNGPASFTGLAPGYDYYGTCNAGPCLPSPTGRRAVHLPAGGMIDLAQATVHPAGTTCNAPLGPGYHHVAFTLDLRGARVCGPSSNSVYSEPPAPPAPPPPPPPPPRPICPPLPVCGIACDGPPLRDAQGCATCGCEDLTGLEPTR
jgi:hypothetical protein